MCEKSRKDRYSNVWHLWKCRKRVYDRTDGNMIRQVLYGMSTRLVMAVKRFRIESQPCVRVGKENVFFFPNKDRSTTGMCNIALVVSCNPLES